MCRRTQLLVESPMVSFGQGGRHRSRSIRHPRTAHPTQLGCLTSHSTAKTALHGRNAAVFYPIVFLNAKTWLDPTPVGSVEAFFAGEGGELEAGAQAEFFVDIVQVDLDGADAQGERGGDVLVVEAGHHQAGDFLFAR